VRVVLLVTDLQLGGTPLRLAALARALRDLGADVTVGCLAPPGPVSARLEAAGIPTFTCDARGPRDLLTLRRLARHLRRLQPDLVHATLTHANVAARLVGGWLRVPVVTSTATIELERRWHRWTERLTARWDCGHVVNSRAVAEHVQRAFRLPPEHVHVVPPLITTVPPRIDRGLARAKLGLPADAFVVLWAGRFDPVKRIDVCIRCAELLADSDCHLLLAGDGPLRGAIEQRGRTSLAAKRIHLLGWQDDLGPAMSAADALLLPSRTEGLPNTVLQAMAFGLPVVAADIPALRELAGDPPRLLLVEAADPQPYVHALRRLRTDAALRAAFVQRARAWAAPYADPHVAARTTIAVYQRVIRSSST